MTHDPTTEEPAKHAFPFGAVVAVLVLAVCSYFIAYVALGERWTMRMNSNRQIMNYRYEWQAAFFRPAARLDSLAFQRRVDTDCGFDKP